MSDQDIASSEAFEEDVADDASSSTRGNWAGSDVTPDEIEWLQRTFRIPEGVECRIPGNEIEPDPREGEYVVFTSHFERGFGLPISDFLKQFMEHYHLQPHHLPANAMVLLSSAVTLSEGFLGLLPTIEFWAKYHTFRTQVKPDPNSNGDKEMVQCGAAALSPRRFSILPRVKGSDSVKMWQRSFFYVKNSTPTDKIRLPEYAPGVPSNRSNWKYTPDEDVLELKLIHSQIVELKDKGLTSDDILRCFISRRISPLQLRTHKICYTSGRLDPNRTSVHILDKYEIYKRVKAIAATKMVDSHWRWGLKPHTRLKPP